MTFNECQKEEKDEKSTCTDFGVGHESFADCVFRRRCADKGTGGEEKPAAQTPQKETFGLNEAAVFKDLKFTATALEESKGADFFEPESGNVFVGVQFTIENISGEEQSVSSVLLFDGYVDDIKCSYSLSAGMAFGDSLDGSLAPGKKLVGYYALEVPEGWQKLELDVQSNWLSSNSARFLFEK